MNNNENHEKTWVYGVIPAGAKLGELERRSDRLPTDVRVVEFGDLGAIVGDAPGDDAMSIRNQALAHARVLEAAVVDAPVVPFQFGTVVADGSVGGELLGAYRDELGQLLERVKDRVQMTLKAQYLEDVVLHEIVTSQPEIAQLREQTRDSDEMATRDLQVRLGELVSIVLEQVRERDGGAILEHLDSLSVASTIRLRESEFMALNAAFLVERGQTRQFEEAAGLVAAQQAERMQLTLLGPMPAFDFVGERQLPWD
jgi:hypothetical protein